MITSSEFHPHNEHSPILTDSYISDSESGILPTSYYGGSYIGDDFMCACDSALISKLFILTRSGGINKDFVQLATSIVSILGTNDYSSSELIDTISTLLKCCDNIPPDIQRSLEERLYMEKKEERREILSLYPVPRQGTGKDRRYRCRPYVCGKNDKREVCKPTLEEAEDEIIRRHKEKEVKSMTLWEALKMYNNDRDDICDSTKVHHEQDIKRFAGELIDKPISIITAIEIQKAYVSAVIETNAAKRACNNYKGILRRVFKHARKHYGCATIDIEDCIDDLNNEVNKKIFKKVNTPMLFDDHHDHYLNNEVLDFLDEASRRGTLRAYAASEPFFTGKRISEVSGVYKSDLDLNKRIITLCHAGLINKRTNEYYIGAPKGGKSRIIVIPEVAIPYYERILEISDPKSPYLFPDNSKKRRCDWLARHKIDKEIADICKTIGIERKSAHDMRRTYDSMLDDAAMPSALRHLLVGHELTGIEASYLRDNHELSEVQAVIDATFERFLGKDFKFV